MSFIDWYYQYQDWIMLGCMFITIAFILIVFYSLKKMGVDVLYTRKGIHISAGCYSFFWLMASDSQWARWIAAIPPAVFVLVFLLIGFKLIPAKSLVDSMSRTGEPFDLVKGTLFYSIVMTLICIFVWKDQPWGLIAIMTVAWGDGLAPIVGQNFGKIKYKSLSGSKKTLEGSLTMFIASVVFSFIICLAFGFQVFSMNNWLWGKILILVLAGTIVEGLSPTDIDNIMVPLTVILLSWAFGLVWLNPLK